MTDNDDYDYIIVGGGPTGSALAQVLAAPSSSNRVLLVEKRGVMNEVFRQLRQIYPDLPEPDYQFLTQSAYDAARRRWMPFNHAFMTTTHGHVPNRYVLCDNLYNCGVQSPAWPMPCTWQRNYSRNWLIQM